MLRRGSFASSEDQTKAKRPHEEVTTMCFKSNFQVNPKPHEGGFLSRFREGGGTRGVLRLTIALQTWTLYSNWISLSDITAQHIMGKDLITLESYHGHFIYIFNN